MAKGRHRGEGRHLFNTDHNTQGKGDAERVADMETFRRNMDEVKFPGVKGLVREGNHLRKVYR
jgi:hypothetical protein